MEIRKSIASLHALKAVGIHIGADQLKKHLAGATGQSAESLLVQFGQNLAMDAVEDQTGKTWGAHQEEIAKKGRAIVDTINRGHEWHMDNF